MKRHFWIYGILIGIGILALQAVKHHVMIRDLKLEIFGLILVIIAIPIGILLGRGLKKKNSSTTITYISRPQDILSDREMDVLKLIVMGYSNQEIADSLFVSLNTIKTHISNIYQKLCVQRRTQAIQKAKAMGIISEKEA